jgi:hypothetical protein
MSKNSIIRGTLPNRSIAGTVLTPFPRSLKATKSVNLVFGRGISFSMAYVIMAKVPSEPISSCVKSKPDDALTYLPPVLMTSPVRKHSLKAEDKVPRDTVFHRHHPSSVGGYVAAYRCGFFPRVNGIA